MRFTTVTSGARTDSRYAYDDDWTAASYMGFSDLTRRRWVVNQELRLDTEPGATAGGISRWTLGAFYSDVDETTRYTDTDPDNIRGLKTAYHSTNTALFGQLGHDFTPRTRLVWLDAAAPIDDNLAKMPPGTSTRRAAAISRVTVASSCDVSR